MYFVKVLSKKNTATTGSSSDTARLSMMYDGSGRRISKTFLTKSATAASWDTVKVTHYTGIGTEVREEFHNGSREKVNVVVNMPQGLGRYKVADASHPADDNASRTFEWYLKNHLGSTMLVYGTVVSTDPNTADIGETKAAYDYRAFGEMVTLTQPSDKVTENFTGKEHDDEISLDYFGARYLDPMLGMWISVDPLREFLSDYAYGPANPINGFDSDGAVWKTVGKPYYTNVFWNWLFNFIGGMGQSSNKMGRKIYYSANSNPTDIRVRHITQKWVYDPNASDEVNALHPFGTRRTIDQTKIDEMSAKMQYRSLYGDGPMLEWNDNMNWAPQVFDNSYKEFPSLELDYSNVYEPNGTASFESVTIEDGPSVIIVDGP